MANEEHLAILKSGVDKWNKWRELNPSSLPKLNNVDLSSKMLINANFASADLSNADLSSTDLRDADLSLATLNGAKLSNANLSYANLSHADLTNANLSFSDLYEVNLGSANLTKANLLKADLSNANLNGADLSSANLYNANLSETNLSFSQLINTYMNNTILINTNLKYSRIENCSVYGVSVWDIDLHGALQKNLIISPDDHAIITVDNLKVAQFIYLLLNNAEIRDVLDTITGKAVLILGRFTEERKVVLDGIRDALRAKGYLPILFDFEKPTSRDLTETVVTLAHLSRFVIADLTSPSSIPHEIMSFTRDLPSVPVQPIILKEHRQYAMFEHLQRYNWVLPVHEYESQDSLILELNEKVIEPLEKKSLEQRPKPL